jgi:hypothetical protein
VRERLLSPLALDFLWEALDAGDPPYPLEVTSHGATVDSRAMLRRRMRDEMVAGQLLDHTGRLEPQLEEWLGTIAQPDLSIDSVFLPDLNQPAVCVLAASGRAGAVLATQRPDGLLLRSIPPDGLVSAIVSMLPPAKRGTETSISVPIEELARQPVAAGGGGVRASVAETRKALAKLTSLPNQRGGQLAVNIRTDMRGRRRSPVLSWFDNETGRYLTQTRGSTDGTNWVTVAPADAATLRQRLAEMITQTSTDRR